MKKYRANWLHDAFVYLSKLFNKINMATVQTNPIVNGLSGMLGRTIVFKTLRGKTIMANRPSPPKKESEQQKTNRSKFKDAPHWAHQVLLDPVKKDYYLKKRKS